MSLLFLAHEKQTLGERLETKGLTSRTMAVQVHYKSLYNSQPSPAKQQRELTGRTNQVRLGLKNMNPDG